MAARRTWIAAYSRHRTLPARLAKDGEMPLEQSGNHHCHRSTNVVAEYCSNEEGRNVEQVSKSAQMREEWILQTTTIIRGKGGGTMLMLMMIIQIQQFVISG